eukprot:1150986-Pelagomonas_calceolata.AAC.5
MFLPGLSSSGNLGNSGQSLVAKVPKVLVLTFLTRPPQAPRTAPVNTTSSAYFCGCPCRVRGPRVPVPGTLQPACGLFQLADEPTAMHNANCNGIFG